MLWGLYFFSIYSLSYLLNCILVLLARSLTHSHNTYLVTAWLLIIHLLNSLQAIYNHSHDIIYVVTFLHSFTCLDSAHGRSVSTTASLCVQGMLVHRPYIVMGIGWCTNEWQSKWENSFVQWEAAISRTVGYISNIPKGHRNLLLRGSLHSSVPLITVWLLWKQI